MATVREHEAFSALFLADPTMKERGASLLALAATA